MQIPLKWGKLKFSVSIQRSKPDWQIYMADLDCHIVELPRLPCRRSRVRWSFCDRYKQCDGVSKAKAAVRRTTVKRLTPCVERRMGSRESKIPCKLFTAQKSAKINARGMRRSKTKGLFFVLLSWEIKGAVCPFLPQLKTLRKMVKRQAWPFFFWYTSVSQTCSIYVSLKFPEILGTHKWNSKKAGAFTKNTPAQFHYSLSLWSM